MLLPLRGSISTSAAETTPGRARIFCSKSCLNATRPAYGTFRRRKRSRPAMTTPFCEKPASTARRLRRLPEKSSAPTTSTSDSATCETTSPWRNPKRLRLAVAVRPADLNASAGETRDARSAGTKPNKMQVRLASPKVKASRRQSGLRLRKGASPSMPREATRNLLSAPARKSPSAPPSNARRRRSVIECRTSRLREAPMAKRTVNSCSRVVARASIRLARFAQAINKTKLAVPSRSDNDSEY